jgi:DNA gyrase inhibitor GyrI
MIMEELNVRIVRLAPMRVASAYGFGPSPEEIAWQTLLNWAEACGLLDVEPAPRFFGFNNPSPSSGSLNYGYEQWMTVGPDVAGGDGVTIKEVAGGLYAVTRCENLVTITETWHRLATWCEGSPYVIGQHQWLEECFTPGDEHIEDYVFDLYLPIVE